MGIKKASSNDIEFLWYLRNQPDVYKYSIQNRPVSWKEHINWIMPIILGLSNKKLFIIKKRDLSAGQIRLDYLSDKEVEISISVLKEFRGQGLAKKAVKEIFRKLKNGEKMIAEIHKENMSSIKFFKKLGFKQNE